MSQLQANVEYTIHYTRNSAETHLLAFFLRVRC